jgi:hypothetical protein
MNPVRRNPLAIAVASLVYFLLGGVWFTVLKQQWLDGIGRTMDQLTQAGVSPAISYGAAIVTGYPLTGMILAGAILGAWKKKA